MPGNPLMPRTAHTQHHPPQQRLCYLWQEGMKMEPTVLVCERCVHAFRFTWCFAHQAAGRRQWGVMSLALHPQMALSRLRVTTPSATKPSADTPQPPAMTRYSTGRNRLRVDAAQLAVLSSTAFCPPQA